MAKAMIFVDGSWLYINNRNLTEAYGSEFQLDYGKLPSIMAREVAKQVGMAEIDVVRTYLFGSYAVNCDERDERAEAARIDFFDLLKEEYHYEIEIYPINYDGRRLARRDRDPNDPWEPKEKCVDIALATSMLYLAAIPLAYDIAIVLIGDRDFIPALQYVRRLGKRVAIASIRSGNSCAHEYWDPQDKERVRDFDIIWLDDLLNELERRREKKKIECKDPEHIGQRLIWTDEFVRKSRPYYCQACRGRRASQRKEREAQSQIQWGNLPTVGSIHEGEVEFIHENGWGIIKSEACNWYFYCKDLLETGENVIKFEEIAKGMRMEFEVKTLPNQNLPRPRGTAWKVKKAKN